MGEVLDPFTDRAHGGELSASFERAGHLARRCEAIARLACETAKDDVIEAGGERADDGARALWQCAKELVEEDRLRIAAHEEAPAGEELPEDDRRRVDIGLARDLAAAELLGRHVRELPLHLAFARRLFAQRCAGDAEVEDAGRAVGPDQNVLRRHVAMHDVERLADLGARFVRGVKTVKNV